MGRIHLAVVGIAVLLGIAVIAVHTDVVPLHLGQQSPKVLGLAHATSTPPLKVFTIRQLMTSNSNALPWFFETHGKILAIEPYRESILTLSSEIASRKLQSEVEIEDNGSFAIVLIDKNEEPEIYQNLRVGDELIVRGLDENLHCRENKSEVPDCAFFHIIQDPVPVIIPFRDDPRPHS